MWTSIILAGHTRCVLQNSSVHEMLTVYTPDASTSSTPHYTGAPHRNTLSYQHSYQRFSKSTPLFDCISELLNLVIDITLSRHELLNLLVCVHDSGVIPAPKLVADLR